MFAMTEPGGAGCPCAAHGDCDLPLCIVAPEGARCARACVEACPGGQRCVLYNGGGVDGATIELRDGVIATVDGSAGVVEVEEAAQ